MEDYEKETGRFAIWRGRITEGFKKWKKGEKIYESDKERIMILVPENTKSRWQEFVKDEEYSSVSKLIRDSVELFIETKEKKLSSETLTQISHKLKERLTIIKGYTQILLENYKDSFDWDLNLKIQTIYDQILMLENEIIDGLEEDVLEETQCDILIVEDDILTINLLIDFFKGKGYTCKFFTRGEGALKAIKKLTPKIILLDILLPGIDGYELCKKIKSNDKLKNIPVFYITAVPQSKVDKSLEETKANGYFLKPFNFTEFEILYDYL